MPVKFKSELGVVCVVVLLCALLLGLGWLMGGDRVLALGNDLAQAEQPEQTEAAPADPEPTPADEALAITEADELQATRAAAKSVTPAARTVTLGLDTDAAAQTAAYSLAPVLQNGAYVSSAYVENGQAFLSIPDVCKLLGFDCKAERDGETVTYTVEGVQIQLTCGEKVFAANGRMLYVADGVKALNGDIVLPPETMTKLFGAAITYDTDAGALDFDPAGKAILQDGESYYAQFDLHWLSHIIYAESNGQPLEGMIGVGNVVLNRVASEAFPNTIEGVVFQSGQFNPVDMGTIYLEPSEQAVLAAKLALEGVNTVGESTYFVNPAIGNSAWFNKCLTCTIVIADHAFYA